MSDHETQQRALSFVDRPAMELTEGVEQSSSQQSIVGRLSRVAGFCLLLLAAGVMLALIVFPDLAGELSLLARNRSLDSRASERARLLAESHKKSQFWMLQQRRDAADRSGPSRREIRQVIEGLGGKWNATKDRVQFDRTRVSDSELEVIRHIQILVELSLAETQITDAGLAHVAEVQTLRELDLTETPITDQGIPQLTKPPRIRSLSLEGTQVTDGTISILKEMPRLRSLNLSGTQVTDAGLKELQTFIQLTSLTLSLDPPTQAAIDKLTAALPDCRIMVED